mmetsp:Transcript_4675/g.10249  ORF Transcript_4675/g.10249 Transcript_4675/m.10249 type:complete len:226 (-) Transcript_4675:2178-2855(-)
MGSVIPHGANHRHERIDLVNLAAATGVPIAIRSTVFARATHYAAATELFRQVNHFGVLGRRTRLQTAFSSDFGFCVCVCRLGCLFPQPRVVAGFGIIIRIVIAIAIDIVIVIVIVAISIIVDKDCRLDEFHSRHFFPLGQSPQQITPVRLNGRIQWIQVHGRQDNRQNVDALVGRRIRLIALPTVAFAYVYVGGLVVTVTVSISVIIVLGSTCSGTGRSLLLGCH